MELEELKETFKLTKEEHEEILQKIIHSALLNKKRTSNPQITFVIGQPGSGKSTLMTKLDFASSVSVNSDEYRKYVDYTGKIIKNYPSYYAYLTNYDAHLLGDELAEYSLNHGYSVIREKAPTDSKKFLQTIEKYSKKYSVKLIVVATGDLNSLLSTRERYEKELQSKDSNAKLSDLRKHNESYQAIREIIKEVKNVEIEIYAREGKKVTIIGNAICTLISQQETDNENNRKLFDSRLEKIKNSMNQRKAPIEQFEDIKQIEKKIKEISKRN